MPRPFNRALCFSGKPAKRLRSFLSIAFCLQRSRNSHSGQWRLRMRSGGESFDNTSVALRIACLTCLEDDAVLTVVEKQLSPYMILAESICTLKAWDRTIASNVAIHLSMRETLFL